jgi:hypothetical protein
MIKVAWTKEYRIGVCLEGVSMRGSVLYLSTPWVLQGTLEYIYN